MNELMISKRVETIESIEVAKMMDKEHKEIMWMIDGNKKRGIVGIKPTLNDCNAIVSDYFIESTYKDSMNRNKKCYSVTKKGCELIIQYSTGKKGYLLANKLNDSFHDDCKTITIINLDRKEIEFLDQLEQALQPFNIKGERQYSVLNYRIDYYIPSLNIAIEYDENDHINYTYEQHEGRQRNIEKELGCRFIRVSDNNTNAYNIGLVIKKIFNINKNNTQ